MAQNIFKFTAVWFAAAVLLGVVLFFTTGDSGSINPAIEDARLQTCEGAGGGFSGNQAQECLAQVERTLGSLASDVRSSLMFWFSLNALTVLMLGLLFVVGVVKRAATAGVPAEFRSMQGSWFIYLVLIVGVTLLFAVLAHFGSFFGSWGGQLDPMLGWGIPPLSVLVWALTYWLGTRIATPDKMKPSVPGA